MWQTTSLDHFGPNPEVRKGDRPFVWEQAHNLVFKVLENATWAKLSFVSVYQLVRIGFRPHTPRVPGPLGRQF